MSPMSATLLLIALLVACALAGGYSWWSLHRERLGREIHAHADGTVHEHHRGSRPHEHPTTTDRYDSLLSRVFRESV